MGPGKDTHGTPVLLRRKAVGGPTNASRDVTKTTRPRLQCLFLGDKHGSGAGSRNRRSTEMLPNSVNEHVVNTVEVEKS